MHKHKTLIISIFLVIFIGVGVFVYFKYEENKKLIPVYITTHQLTQRKRITIDDLQLIYVSKDYISDDIYFDLDDIENKYVKLSYSIPKGSFIYKSAIEDNIKDLANTLLKQGEVNYDIYTSDIKINTALLNKNMYIDLYLTIKDRDLPISDLLLKNLRITGLYDYDNNLIEDYDDSSKVYIVSVALNNEYVSLINKALIVGQLYGISSNNTYDMKNSSILNEDSVLLEYLSYYN